MGLQKRLSRASPIVRTTPEAIKVRNEKGPDMLRAFSYLLGRDPNYAMRGTSISAGGNPRRARSAIIV